MHSLKLKNTILIGSFFLLSPYFFVGCMTSSRQDELQISIDKLNDQVSKIQNQVSSKDQQINNTTQTALASQNEAQSLRDQLQLTQGAVDELRNKIKKIEENSGTNSSTSSANVISIDNNAVTISTLQKQIARLELISNSRFSYVRKGKLPAHIKNIADLNKILKAHLDAGNFKEVIDPATMILLAHDATDTMLAAALQFRGEARFQLQDYKGAASDLAGVVEIFPNAPRKARALLLTGDSYVYLKNNAIALLYYQDCSKYFATTAEGKAAASRLATLTAQMNAAPAQQN